MYTTMNFEDEDRGTSSSLPSQQTTASSRPPDHRFPTPFILSPVMVPNHNPASRIFYSPFPSFQPPIPAPQPRIPKPCPHMYDSISQCTRRHYFFPQPTFSSNYTSIKLFRSDMTTETKVYRSRDYRAIQDNSD